jgi:small subunit ribosomal protein S6
MAYPINRVIDGDYIVTRVEMEPSAVAPLEATLRIDERIFRHLVVRADELPVPLPPREPRQQPAPPPAPVAEAAPAAVAETPAAVAPAPRLCRNFMKPPKPFI